MIPATIPIAGTRSRVAVYPGTFDPITNGHVDILRRSLVVFDRVIVAIADNVRKAPLFSVDERIGFIREALGSEGDIGRVEFDVFGGLLVDYCQKRGAITIVRGLRAPADFEYEFQLAVMNRRLAPNVDTMFLMTAEENFYVSSSLIKEVASFGGDVSGLVPDSVCRALEKKFERTGGSRP
ncbi:MAG: pantetheine-phosphate adenylyltransferase [Deltaproteobacteria bacterium]|nr:pantetheine-phosphate adenylyltransferase [Deltaproteobacteria bacterium]